MEARKIPSHPISSLKTNTLISRDPLSAPLRSSFPDFIFINRHLCHLAATLSPTPPVHRLRVCLWPTGWWQDFTADLYGHRRSFLFLSSPAIRQRKLLSCYQEEKGAVGDLLEKSERTSKIRRSETFKYGLSVGLGILGISPGGVRCVFQTEISLFMKIRDERGFSVRSFTCSSKKWDSSEITGALLNSLGKSWISFHCTQSVTSCQVKTLHNAAQNNLCQLVVPLYIHYTPVHTAQKQVCWAIIYKVSEWPRVTVRFTWASFKTSKLIMVVCSRMEVVKRCVFYYSCHVTVLWIKAWFLT